MTDRDPLSLYPHQEVYYWLKVYGATLAIGISFSIFFGLFLLAMGKML